MSIQDLFIIQSVNSQFTHTMLKTRNIFPFNYSMYKELILKYVFKGYGHFRIVSCWPTENLDYDWSSMHLFLSSYNFL